MAAGRKNHLMESIVRNQVKDQDQDQARHSRSVDNLAKQLIADYGIEGAKRICREYCWDGVSRAIEVSATTAGTPAAAAVGR